MDSITFTFKGQEYQIDSAAEVRPEAGKRYIRILTKDNKQFKMTFKEYIFKWVISEG